MEEYDELREEYNASLDDRNYVSLEAAKQKRLQIDFIARPPAAAPRALGVTVVTPAIEDVLPFVDWTPFFQAWELRGRYPNRIGRASWRESVCQVGEIAGV